MELTLGASGSVSGNHSLNTESESLIAEPETELETYGNISFRRPHNSDVCLIYNDYKCLLIRFNLNKYGIM